MPGRRKQRRNFRQSVFRCHLRVFPADVVIRTLSRISENAEGCFYYVEERAYQTLHFTANFWIR